MGYTGLRIRHYSKASFVELLEYILNEIGIQKVYISDGSVVIKRWISTASVPRFDIPLSGCKHMVFASQKDIRDLLLQPGDVHYAPPLMWKKSIWDTAHEMSSVIFFDDCIRITYIDFGGNDNYYETHNAQIFYHTALPISTAGTDVIHSLNALEIPEAESCATNLVEALFRLVLTQLKNSQETEAVTHHFRKSDVTRQKIFFYLQENFHRPIDRDHVARVFRLNPSYVSRLFSKEYIGGFNKTLRRIRLEHIAILLRKTDMTLGEITSHCGYSSEPFVAAAFKKEFGVTPARYRASCLAEEQQQ